MTKLPPWTAKYKCLSCGHEWDGFAGPSQPDGCPTQCPKCYHLYIKWFDYEERTK